MMYFVLDHDKGLIVCEIMLESCNVHTQNSTYLFSLYSLQWAQGVGVEVDDRLKYKAILIFLSTFSSVIYPLLLGRQQQR